MVKRSTEMKKPNTPIERRKNHMKNWRGSGLISHDANTPANTMNAESRIITTETPSMPSARLIFRGAYQHQLSVRSI